MLCFESTQLTFLMLFISGSLECSDTSHLLASLLPDAGVTLATPVHSVISLVGICPGFGVTGLAQWSVCVPHNVIYVPYIGTRKMVNYVNKTV